MKPLFTIILTMFVFSTAFAQRDTVVYYLKNSLKVVSTKDSADYYLVISPPDTSVDKRLFIVKAFYPNGKLNFTGKSSTNKLGKLNYEGPGVFYFLNGNKKKTMNFVNDVPIGDIVEYYPNGKLYHTKIGVSDVKQLYKECRDSTGKILAKNGNGQWIIFDENFSSIKVKGQVRDGLGFGEWHTTMNDSSEVISEYKNGKIISSSNLYKSGRRTYFSVEQSPEFPGGLKELYAFLGNNIVYPKLARQNGTKGRVIVQFVVQKDGALTNIKVVRGIGDGCDEEVLRVMKLSPLWKPGMQNGKTVDVAYTVPVAFLLNN
jgi:TonB family protein